MLEYPAEYALFDVPREELQGRRTFREPSHARHSSPLLTPEEAADYLRIIVRQLHYLVRSNQLKCLEYSIKHRRFTREGLDEFIKARVGPTQKALDVKPFTRLPSSLKGGKTEISDRAQIRKKLREEMRSWQ